MRFLELLKTAFGLGSKAEPTARAPALFVYVKLPGNITPDERGARFEDPLQEALERTQLGTITGGGSMMNAPDVHGRRTIEYCGLDVDLWDVAAGLALLKSELKRLNAPPGTRLCYELEGEAHEQPLSDDST